MVVEKVGMVKDAVGKTEDNIIYSSGERSGLESFAMHIPATITSTDNILVGKSLVKRALNILLGRNIIFGVSGLFEKPPKNNKFIKRFVQFKEDELFDSKDGSHFFYLNVIKNIETISCRGLSFKKPTIVGKNGLQILKLPTKIKLPLWRRIYMIFHPYEDIRADISMYYDTSSDIHFISDKGVRVYIDVIN